MTAMAGSTEAWEGEQGHIRMSLVRLAATYI